MKLTLVRDDPQNDCTLGELYVDEEFFSYTVEDTVREVKIPGKTAIPAGEYQVKLTMSNRFKKVLPLLLNVPNFDGVRIHAGNDASSTSGCLILGLERTPNGVSSSRKAMELLMPILENATDDIWINIA